MIKNSFKGWAIFYDGAFYSNGGFMPWIYKDKKTAELIIKELTRNIAPTLKDKNKVVLLPVKIIVGKNDQIKTDN